MLHRKGIIRNAGYAALLLCAVFVSYRLGYSQGSGDITNPPLTQILQNTRTSGDLMLVTDDPATKVNFGDFWKTWNILDKNFAPTASTSNMGSSTELRVAGAIDGLVRSYNDPYTVFIPKERAEVFKEQVNGEFQGIGAVLTNVNGNIVVSAVLPGSPAQKASIAVGSRIIAVDDAPTAGQDINAVIPHIRGPKGSTVSLTIVGPKSSKELVVAVVRDTVAIPTTATRVVSAAKGVLASIAAKASALAAALPGSQARVEAKAKADAAAKQKFFVLQLSTFAKSSVDAFVTDLQRFAHTDGKYVIIDLRNNPGGYLDVAQDLASYFLPAGTLVVTEKTGATQQVTEYRSKGYPLLSGATTTRRIVVLVNRNSASASEILAGALQDHHMAKIVGETSFGKGSVQTLVDIGDVGSLKVTIARWYTPSGKNISHIGIAPDIAVDIHDPKFASSTDPFMDAAVETILDDSLWQ